MKLTEKIAEAKKTLFSFELLPPRKGAGIESIFSAIEPLMAFDPSFINVTYHREEFVLRKRPDGSFDRISLRKRPGTVAICAAIMNRFGVEAVPHLICGGFTKDETENALIDLNFLGISNVLALRGDNLKGERNFVPEEGGNSSSVELIEQIKNMNQGIYLDQELKNPHPTDFCIGAAGYPEKHIDAPNRDFDLQFLKRKVDAGAEFIATQMFFDNEQFFRWSDKVREMGIDIPIIPGMKPITTKKQVFALPKIFNIDLPNALVESISDAKDQEDAEKIGTEWTIKQCEELKKFGVPVLHFYTMGRSKVTTNVAKALF
jgi:methylenetetrahydrofolate reductase (NADPH)